MNEENGIEETGATMPLPENEPGATAPLPTEPGPRIRWAGIVWGAIFSALALTVLVIITSPDRVDAFGSWVIALGPGGAVVTGVIALGALVLVVGVLAALRAAQRRRA